MAQLLATVPLKRKDGSLVNAGDALKNKIIGLYFSAHWCPPCRQFTPIFRDFYDELLDSEAFEVVFVSLDKSDADLQNYLKESHGDWLYIPFGDGNIKYEIQGVPTLVIIKADGTVINQNGRADVQGKPPKKALDDWKAKN